MKPGQPQRLSSRATLLYQVVMPLLMVSVLSAAVVSGDWRNPAFFILLAMAIVTCLPFAGVRKVTLSADQSTLSVSGWGGTDSVPLHEVTAVSTVARQRSLLKVRVTAGRGPSARTFDFIPVAYFMTPRNDDPQVVLDLRYFAEEAGARLDA